MKRWPLKVKFGIYSSLLVVVVVTGAILALRPIVYRYQLKELDDLLTNNASELLRDLENDPEAPKDFRQPIPSSVIPIPLRGRYLQILGPEGQQIHRSANMRQHDLSSLPPGFRTITLEGRNARIGTFENGYRTIHIGTRLGAIEGVQSDLLDALLWVAPATLISVFLGGWLLARRALRPIKALTSSAELIDATNPGARLPLPPARDEIHRLTEVLNRSFDRLEKAYATAAQFSADASHQLRTPLSVLRNDLDQLSASANLTPHEQTALESMRKQTRRLSSMVADLLLLAQADAGRLQFEAMPIDLGALTAAALDDAEAIGAERGLTMESSIATPLMALGDARRTAIILQNLTENALKYVNAGGRVKVRCFADGPHARVIISNTGNPVPAQFQTTLFERFNRAGQAEDIKGSGLGLNIARSLALNQNGDVVLVKSDDEGTVFSFHLPLAPAGQALPSGPSAPLR